MHNKCGCINSSLPLSELLGSCGRGGSQFLFIYLFLAALGLRCCAQAFSSCGGQGLLFVAVLSLLTAVASPVEEHGL